MSGCRYTYLTRVFRAGELDSDEWVAREVDEWLADIDQRLVRRPDGEPSYLAHSHALHPETGQLSITVVAYVARENRS